MYILKLYMDIVCQPVYSVYSITSTEISYSVSEISKLGLNVNWNNVFYKKAVLWSRSRKEPELLAGARISKFQLRLQVS